MQTSGTNESPHGIENLPRSAQSPELSADLASAFTQITLAETKILELKEEADAEKNGFKEVTRKIELLNKTMKKLQRRRSKMSTFKGICKNAWKRLTGALIETTPSVKIEDLDDLRLQLGLAHAERETAQERIEGFEAQINSLKMVVAENNESTRVLWRVPTEIWCMIFLEGVRGRLDKTNRGNGFPPLYYPDLTAIKISAVCHVWRTIAMSYGELWSNIPIVWEDLVVWSISRIRHYHCLSSGNRRTLFINRSSAWEQEDASELGQIFQDQATIESIVYVLHATHNPTAYFILNILPPARELWILRHHTQSGTPLIPIPLHHCRTTRKIYLDSTRVEWAAPDELHLDEYIAHVSDEFIRHPHRSIPGSLPTLQIAHLDATSLRFSPPAIQDRPLLGTLHTVRTNIHFLALHFVRWYQTPGLRRLEILTASHVPVDVWRMVHSYLDFAQIKEIVCTPMNGEQESLAERIADFQSVTYLDIRGDNVSGMLSYWTRRLEAGHFVFPFLECLTISNSYEASYPIMAFMEARNHLQRANPGTTFPVPKVQLDGCVDVPMQLWGIFSHS